jgi:hypothetical protein
VRTTFILLAQYEKAIVSVDEVCRDYFTHLTPAKFVRKVEAGEIKLPLIRIEGSQKCAKGVHLSDLARYIDARADEARREFEAMHRGVK